MRTGLVIILSLGIAYGGYWWLENNKQPAPGSSAMEEQTIRFACADSRSFTAHFKSGEAVVELRDSDHKVHKLTEILPTIPGAGDRYESADKSVHLAYRAFGTSLQEDGATTYSKCAPQ